jgi:hypothetical protein
MRTWFRGIALLVGTTLLASTAGAATADIWRHPDPTGDVWKFDADAGVMVKSSLRTNVDLLLTSARYAPRAVYFRARFANLARTTDSVAFFVNVRTSANDEVHSLVASFDPRHRDGLGGYSCGPGETCKGLRVRIDYAHDIVLLRVPRRCFDNPRWIRYQASVLNYHHPNGTVGNEHTDNALTRAADSEVWSPRIRRG